MYKMNQSQPSKSANELASVTKTTLKTTHQAHQQYHKKNYQN